MKRILALAAALTVASGCTHGARNEARGNRIVIGVIAQPDSLNPLLASGADTAAINPMLFSYLLEVDDKGQIVPDVAEAVPSAHNGGISADGLTITYHLRHGVQWSDGTPLTAADVIYTYGLIMNPAINVPARTGYDVVASASAPDAYTVRVRLKRPYSPTLRNFFAPDQNYPILPKHILARETNINRGAFSTQPVGSGPYRLVSWRHGDSLTFAANPLYFRGEPKIGTVVMKTVSSLPTLFTQLRTGEIQALFPNNAQFAQNYVPVPNVTVARNNGGGIAVLILNTSDPILRDLSVRQAIAQGVDYRRIVHDATRGTQTTVGAGHGLYGWTYDPAIALSPYDRANAEKLLDAAGWKMGSGGVRRRNGVPLAVTYAYPTDDAQASDIGLFFAQQLRKIGFDVTERSYPPQIFVAPAANGGPLLSGRFQLAFTEMLTPTDPALDWFFGCDQFPPNGFNLARLCDPAITAANDASVRTYDPALRVRESRIVQKRVVADVPIVPLYEQGTIAIYPNDLAGVAPSQDAALWNIGSWYFK